jgi:hypothetical protein
MGSECEPTLVEYLSVPFSQNYNEEASTEACVFKLTLAKIKSFMRLTPDQLHLIFLFYWHPDLPECGDPFLRRGQTGRATGQNF